MSSLPKSLLGKAFKCVYPLPLPPPPPPAQWGNETSSDTHTHRTGKTAPFRPTSFLDKSLHFAWRTPVNTLCRADAFFRCEMVLVEEDGPALSPRGVAGRLLLYLPSEWRAESLRAVYIMGCDGNTRWRIRDRIQTSTCVDALSHRSFSCTPPLSMLAINRSDANTLNGLVFMGCRKATRKNIHRERNRGNGNPIER